MKLMQHDYDDGFQELEVIDGDERWEERRLYKGQDIDIYYQLREDKVDDAIIYRAIQKFSKCVKTTREVKDAPHPIEGWTPPHTPATYA